MPVGHLAFFTCAATSTHLMRTVAPGGKRGGGVVVGGRGSGGRSGSPSTSSACLAASQTSSLSVRQR